MSRELVIGILALTVALVSIWGYQLIKGKNLFKTTSSYEVLYSNVEGLEIAAPVEINGFTIGSIQSIDISKDNVSKMLVKFDIEGDYVFPKSTKAVLAANNSLVGSKKIILDFDAFCQNDCLTNGDRMISSSRGVLETILPKKDLEDHLKLFRQESRAIMDSLLTSIQSPSHPNSISRSLENMEKTMYNMSLLTKNLNHLISSTNNDTKRTMANFANITSNLSANQNDINSILANISKLTSDLANTDFNKKTELAFKSVDTLMSQLENTMQVANQSFENLNQILNKVNSDEGNFAQLLNDKELYTNLQESSKHLSLLLQDLRLNPKRYMRFSVFGRKGKQYTYPEEDPALIKLKNKKNTHQ